LGRVEELVDFLQGATVLPELRVVLRLGVEELRATVEQEGPHELPVARGDQLANLLLESFIILERLTVSRHQIGVSPSDPSAISSSSSTFFGSFTLRPVCFRRFSIVLCFFLGGAL